MDTRFLRSLLHYARASSGSERMRLLAIAEEMLQSGEDFAVDEEIWRTTEQGKHYAIEAETGEVTKGNIGQKEESKPKAGASKPTTAKQANDRIKYIVGNAGDNEKRTKDIIEVLRSAGEGTRIRMPDSWNGDDGKPTIYEKNENGGWTDISWGGAMRAEEMADHIAYGAEDPNETPKITKFVPNEKYIPTDDIKWKDSGKMSEEEFQRRYRELFDEDMSEAMDRARRGLYEGQSQFFGRYMSGVSYGEESHNAFNSYIYHGDTLINGMLRGSEPRSEDQSKEWQENKERTKKYIDQMTEAIDKNPLRKDAVVFRGLRSASSFMKNLGLELPEGTNVRDLFADHDFIEGLTGRTYTDPGFASTSIDKDYPKKGGFDNTATLEILLPKGTKGTYFGDALKITDEHEFLLQRGTKFMICSAYVTGYDEPQLHIRAAVIGQEPQKIPELKTYKG